MDEWELSNRIPLKREDLSGGRQCLNKTIIYVHLNAEPSVWLIFTKFLKKLIYFLSLKVFFRTLKTLSLKTVIFPSKIMQSFCTNLHFKINKKDGDSTFSIAPTVRYDCKRRSIHYFRGVDQTCLTTFCVIVVDAKNCFNACSTNTLSTLEMIHEKCKRHKEQLSSLRSYPTFDGMINDCKSSFWQRIMNIRMFASLDHKGGAWMKHKRWPLESIYHLV